MRGWQAGEDFPKAKQDDVELLENNDESFETFLGNKQKLRTIIKSIGYVKFDEEFKKREAMIEFVR